MSGVFTPNFNLGKGGLASKTMMDFLFIRAVSILN